MKHKQKMQEEKAITLIALVITIIVLIILAVVTINITFGENGLFYTAKEARMYQLNAEAYDNERVEEIAKQIQEKVDEASGILSTGKVESVNNKVKDGTGTLGEVAYTAKTITNPVTVEGTYNGGLADQVFNQSELWQNATTSEEIKWYVLYADENGVNLVSNLTKKKVEFKDSSGYDNCLYYLNELSKLFVNEDYGVTADRVHALRLTDIKKAAEVANEGYKVIDANSGLERDWSWDLDVINASSTAVYNNGNIGQKTYTPTDKYYPGLYTANANKEVVTNNPMYDEEPGNKITTDGGITRTLADESNPASTLTLNRTYFSSISNEALLTMLGIFGESNIGKELFNSSGVSYWLASRCAYGERWCWLLRNPSD